MSSRAAFSVRGVGGLFLNHDSRCNFLSDICDRVLGRGETCQIRQDSAVLLYIIEGDVVQNWDQCLLTQQDTELPFGPEPAGQVGRCQQRDTRPSLPKAGVHLERLATAGNDRDFIEPHCNSKVLKISSEVIGNFGTIDTGVAKKSVVLTRIECGDRFMYAVRKPTFWFRVSNATRRGPELSIQIRNDLSVMCLRLAVVFSGLRVVIGDDLPIVSVGFAIVIIDSLLVCAIHPIHFVF